MEEIRKINNINLKGLLKELKQSYTSVERLKLFDKYFNIIRETGEHFVLLQSLVTKVPYSDLDYS